jgi:hypothetical protein
MLRHDDRDVLKPVVSTQAHAFRAESESSAAQDNTRPEVDHWHARDRPVDLDLVSDPERVQQLVGAGDLGRRHRLPPAHPPRLRA